MIRGHAIRIGVTPDNGIDLEPVCHEPSGSPCRLGCSGDCELVSVCGTGTQGDYQHDDVKCVNLLHCAICGALMRESECHIVNYMANNIPWLYVAPTRVFEVAIESLWEEDGCQWTLPDSLEVTEIVQIETKKVEQ